jgi:hypothetical protein
MMKTYRMYVLILDDVPLGSAINSVGHAAVAATLKWQDSPETQAWLKDSFRKVTCLVTQEQLDRAIEVEDDYVEITELALDKRVVGVAFKPRQEYHKHFKFLTLFGSNKCLSANIKKVR